ncbi:hypothetical protein [Methylobacter sp.]|uniref:hypothetical protein n=1 Tax=Methylobacter sp. TaxID=2051955 RepID=UPI002FDE103E
MSNKEPRQETLAALDAIFSPSMPKEAMSKHLSLIDVAVILSLRQIEGDEFVLGFLESAIDDIKHGNAYMLRRVKTERSH